MLRFKNWTRPFIYFSKRGLAAYLKLTKSSDSSKAKMKDWEPKLSKPLKWEATLLSERDSNWLNSSKLKKTTNNLSPNKFSILETGMKT